jgi:hypothetical protein
LAPAPPHPKRTRADVREKMASKAVMDIAFLFMDKPPFRLSRFTWIVGILRASHDHLGLFAILL